MIPDTRKEKKNVSLSQNKHAEVKTKDKADSESKTFFLVMGMWCMLDLCRPAARTSKHPRCQGHVPSELMFSYRILFLQQASAESVL